MGSNFNIGSFNTINTNEEKKQKSHSSKGSNDELKKKLLVLGEIILGGAIVLLLILFLLSSFVQKNYSYDDIEEIMKNAAIAYFEDNSDKLPSLENERVEITADILAASEYMKEMTEYTGENLTCTGKVSVQTNGDEYLYIPKLECGEEYTTQTLNEVVTKNVITEGYGLYQMGDSYVYRGEEVNNYLELDKALWRIVKVNENGNFILILETRPKESVPWDNRYNSQVGYNSGINSYSASRILESLNDYYKTNKEDEAILSDEDRSKTLPFNQCIGKRNTNDATKDNSVECATTIENQKIGLLTAADYMNASVDTNCNTILSYSCQNYNYLVTNYKWWLATATNDSTKDVYGVNNEGIVKSTSAASYMYPRAVIMLDANVLYKSGKGTMNKPYKLK